MEIIEEIKLDYAIIYLYDNGIYHTHYLNSAPLNLEKVKELTNLRWELFGKKPALILSTSENHHSVPNEQALEYLHSKERSKTVLAHAYVIKSFKQQLSIKTSDLLKKFSTPTKGFKSKDEAVRWLLSYKK